MPVKQFEFKSEAALEAMLYIASRVEDPTFMRLMKLLYLADKSSLENWGRFVTGDTYVAMQHGPVPSNAYRILQQSQFWGDDAFELEGSYTVRPVRDANTQKLSESDIEELDRAIATYGNLPISRLRKMTHDAAYEAIWEAAGQTSSTEIPLEDIAAECGDSELLIDYLQNGNTD